MLIFYLQSKISEFHFPFTCNRYGRCFCISVYALDFQPRDPWFESGCLQQFFSSLFFSFWPFTVPSPLIIKTRRFANNVINNPFYFIITLFSLDPLLFACNPYGRWLFLKSGFNISVFLSDIAVISAWILLIFEHVVAETSFPQDLCRLFNIITTLS